MGGMKMEMKNKLVLYSIIYNGSDWHGDFGKVSSAASRLIQAGMEFTDEALH